MSEMWLSETQSIPATEVTQNDILVELQNNMNEINIAIKNLYIAIANPSYVDKSANAIRNQVQSGTVTTVTTVTGLTNIDSYQGKTLVVGQNIAAWASVVRGRIG